MAVKTIATFNSLAQCIFPGQARNVNVYQEQSGGPLYISKLIDDGVNLLKLWYTGANNGATPQYIGWTDWRYNPSNSLVVDDSQPTLKKAPTINYPMTHDQIVDLVNSRLKKYNITLDEFAEQYWAGTPYTIHALNLTKIPNAKKRFMENSANYLMAVTPTISKKPMFIGANLDNIDSDFMKEGRLQASSTYIKYPVSFKCFYNYLPLYFEDSLEHQVTRFHDIVLCHTVDEINSWFDKFDAIYPRIQDQMKKTEDAFNYVKTNGKPYKDIMKTYQKRTQQYKDARKDYEAMILNQIKQITALDQINNDF